MLLEMAATVAAAPTKIDLVIIAVVTAVGTYFVLKALFGGGRK